MGRVCDGAQGSWGNHPFLDDRHVDLEFGIHNHPRFYSLLRIDWEDAVSHLGS